MVFRQAFSLHAFSDRVVEVAAAFAQNPFCVDHFINPLGRIMVCLSKKLEDYLWNNYRIDYTKCSGWGIWAAGCPTANTRMKDGRPEFVNDRYCLWCMGCLSNCPGDVVTLEKFNPVAGITPAIVEYLNVCQPPQEMAVISARD